MNIRQIEKILKDSQIPLEVVAIHKSKSGFFIGRVESGWMFFCRILYDEVTINGSTTRINDSYTCILEELK